VKAYIKLAQEDGAIGCQHCAETCGCWSGNAGVCILMSLHGIAGGIAYLVLLYTSFWVSISIKPTTKIHQ